MSSRSDQSQPRDTGARSSGVDTASDFERHFHEVPKGHRPKTSSGDSGYASGQFPPSSQGYTHSSSASYQGQGQQHHHGPHPSHQQPGFGQHFYTAGGAYSVPGPPPAQAPLYTGWPHNAPHAAHGGHPFHYHEYNVSNNPDSHYWQQKDEKDREKLKNARKEIEQLHRERSETADLHQAEVDKLCKKTDDLRNEIDSLCTQKESLRTEKERAVNQSREHREAKRKAEAAQRQTEYNLEAVREDFNKLRQEYTADLLAEGRWAKTIELCQELLDSLNEVLSSLSADNVDSQTVHAVKVAIMETKTKLGEAYCHSGESQEADLRLSEADLCFNEAESCFREAFDFWKTSLKDLYVDKRTTREAQFWLCKALSAQQDNKKLQEALKHHGRARDRLHDSSSNEDDLNWAIKNMLRRPPIFIKQGDFVGAADEIRYAWSAGRRLDDAQLTRLAEHTLDIAGKIPNEHTSQSITMLLCICTSNDCNRIEHEIRFQAQKALLDEYCRGRRWADAKIRLETILASPRVESFLPVKELRARLVLVCRRLREWQSAGTGAVQIFEDYGYADGLSAAAEGVDFMDTLARAIEALAKSADEQDLAVRRSNQRLALDLLSRTHAQAEKLKAEGVPCQRPRLAKIANAGDVLLAERKKAAKSNTPAEKTYKDTKKKLESFKRLVGADGNVQRITVERR